MVSRVTMHQGLVCSLVLALAGADYRSWMLHKHRTFGSHNTVQFVLNIAICVNIKARTSAYCSEAQSQETKKLPGTDSSKCYTCKNSASRHSVATDILGLRG